MPFDVPQQTANERGIEGLPQSLSRMHTAWYKPSNAGAGNQQPVPIGSWERNVVPLSQKAEALGAGAADDDEHLCAICIDAPRTHVLVPCGHKCVCGDCAALSVQRGACPICRAECFYTTRVYE